ncbi:hypothetical protein PLICRDRAFT_54024 [Plicaturopsis crispa FD-325 SS-3]|nr:hypothetical protein PLICRDRAFT_54024 [Plicaturopsis crispa FD-325 SS-3]
MSAIMASLLRPSGQCLRRSLLRAFSSSAEPQRAPKKGDRVVLGVSGGVDSSVAAKLLADQDFDLSAVFMRNWDTRDESGTDHGCEWEKDFEDAQRVCKMLDIPCRMVDLTAEYWTRVFEPSLMAWAQGETPNPDIGCNREVKFGALVDRIDADFGKAWIATGHYARKGWTDTRRPRPMLLRARDMTKDQTYYLSGVTEASLARSVFPIGDYLKSEVREMAHRWNLPTADRSESMGICFIGEKRKFSDFISEYIPPEPGPIVDISTGKVVGEHRGLWTYTIGQGARIAGLKEKFFVVRKYPLRNTICIAPGTDKTVNPSLYASRILVRDWKWISEGAPPSGLDHPRGLRLRVQVRHNMDAVGCSLHIQGGMTIIDFDEPEKAVAPGQCATVWDGERCLGSGTIDSTVGLRGASKIEY